MKILSIESSCDETSAAVVEKIDEQILVLSNITATSLQMHASTGGIIPENAARMQVRYIMPVIVEALVKSWGSVKKTDNSWDIARKILETEIDAIAVTYGPGLIGSLLVGVETAKTLSYVFDKPLIPVNHLLAHIFANFISENIKSVTLNSKSNSITINQKSKIQFPFIGFIVSGAHTDLLYFESHTKYTWLGGTRDDAAGEAFDKIGRLLGLSYPAGAEIERRSSIVTNPTIKFKSPIMHEDNFDFSFSGLKTEVSRYVQTLHNSENEQSGNSGIANNRSWTSQDDTLINEVCYASQKAIIDVLVKKCLKASKKYNCHKILVGGGVSASQTFQQQLELEAKNQKLEVEIHFPDKKYTTDNGAMIGAYALQNPVPMDFLKVNANPELYFA